MVPKSKYGRQERVTSQAEGPAIPKSSPTIALSRFSALYPALEAPLRGGMVAEEGGSAGSEGQNPLLRPESRWHPQWGTAPRHTPL